MAVILPLKERLEYINLKHNIKIMKILFVLFMVTILAIFFTNSAFSQRGDTITVIDVKSIMESYQNKNPDTIAYMFTEHPAVFIGGKDSLDSYIKRVSLRNVTKFVKNKTKILCWVIIEKNGCISEVEMITHNNPELENSIKNTLYSSPRWIPATQDGRKLRYKTILAFNFP